VHPLRMSWSCDVCTFINAQGSTTCAMCGSANVKQKAFLDDTLGWECSSCTVRNTDNRDPTCSVCGTENQSILQTLQLEREEKARKKQEQKRKQKELEEIKKKQLLADQKRRDELDSKMSNVFGEIYPKIYPDFHLFRRSSKPMPTKYRETVSRLLMDIYPIAAPQELPPKPVTTSSCTVCYGDFDDETQAVSLTNCQHSSTCQGCLTTFIQVRIKDGEVLPWIPCPTPDCGIPIHPKDLTSIGVSTLELYQMCCTLMRKTLAQNKNWVNCSTEKCDFGFMLKGKETKMQAKCPVCKKSQTVAKVDPDADVQKLLAEGVIRKCPKCEHPAMKDYGMCNIMECGKCGIWWNWKTRETGKTSRELKDRARARGTLWEPGELAFQQGLQHTNPAKFKELLEKNGIKFDPNYHRGS